MHRSSNCAYIGIGSNLDDPAYQVANAIDNIDQWKGCAVSKRSSLYRTAPIGFADQPEFVNAACMLSTRLSPLELLKALLKLENTLGRIRTGPINGPRLIDLDLLLYENESISTAELELPHPRMHERRFVLEPLVEIDPEIVIPSRGKAVDLLVACNDQQVEKL